MSVLLNLNPLLNKSIVPILGQPQLVYIFIEVVPIVDITPLRLPLNFTLVLDRSGSMAGEKLRTLKEAVKSILEQLNPDDIVSVITFETKTQVLAEAQPAIRKPDLIKVVDRIVDGGGTNMALGLEAGLAQVSGFVGVDRVSRIILLTDGEATDSENDSREVADQAGSMGVPIICLGFGKDWKHDFLIDLADRSLLAPGSQSGYADYIPTPNEVSKIFQEVYQSMQVVAQNAILNLRMVQGVEARRVWQVSPMIREIGADVTQGRAVVIPVGQIEQSGVAYLIELVIPERPVGFVRLAQADIAFQLPGGEQQRQASDLVIEYSADARAGAISNPEVMNIVEKVQAFKLQTQALNEAEVGHVSAATQKLRQAVTILLAQGETVLADQMNQEADRLERTGEMSSEAKKTIKLTSRKTIRLSG